jgi:threonyl-tRNA synthetase
LKIRDAELNKIPFMLVVGDKEQSSRTVSIRRRHKGDLGLVVFKEFVENILVEIKDKRRPENSKEQ